MCVTLSVGVSSWSVLAPSVHTYTLRREDWGLTRTTVKTTALVIFLFAVRSESPWQKQACTVQSTVCLRNVEILMEFHRRKSIRRTSMYTWMCVDVATALGGKKSERNICWTRQFFHPPEPRQTISPAPNHGFMFITAVQLTHNWERAKTFLLLCPSVMHSTYTKSQAQHNMFRFVLCRREVEEDELLSGGFSRRLITLPPLMLAFACS